MQLRHYQEKAIEEIRKSYQQGYRKVLLHLATGGGKTATFCQMIKMASEKGKRCLVVVRGVKLIEQASERLTRDGVEHGVMQGPKSYGLHLPVVVCSIDTLYRRKEVPDADFIVIDEAHQTGGRGYKWFIDQYPRAYFLPVSATPHLKKGMRHVAEKVVYPISIEQLIEEGYLVGSKTYIGHDPDLSEVNVNSTGEFDETQLAEVMCSAALSGVPSKNYRRLADKKKALVFAVNIAHSRRLAEEFEGEGYRIDHIDAKTPIDKRNEILGKLKNGDLDLVTNVGILHTGFDLPALECIILARPTMSYNLHIQMLGRGTRPAPGKEFFTVIDCAGNTRRHGFIEDEEICEIDGKKLKKGSTVNCECSNDHRTDKGEIIPEKAPCTLIYSIDQKVCPACGCENLHYVPKTNPFADSAPEKVRNTITVESEMEEYKRGIQSDTDRLIKIAKNQGYKKGWIYNKLREKYGEAEASEVWESRIKRMKVWKLRDQTIQNLSPPSFTSSTSRENASFGQITPGLSKTSKAGSYATAWWARQTLLDSTNQEDF